MGTRCEVKEVTYPQDFHPLSEPLPYYPALGRALGGVTISLVVCYLEIHHPAPTPEKEPSAGLKNAPIYLDCTRAAEDMGVSRRTLHLSLCCIGTWYRSEGERERSARAGREFINPVHSIHGKIKPYSFVGSKAWRVHRILTIRRNPPQLHLILASVGLSIPNTQPDTLLSPLSQTPANEQFTRTLPQILDDVCGIRQDRREDRWDRARKAVGSGLLAERVLHPEHLVESWGWSEERRRVQSERMRVLWSARRADKEMREKS